MKLKKFITIIISIILILLLIFESYEIYIRIDEKLDKSNIISREEVIELLNKGKNCRNFKKTIVETWNLRKVEQNVFVKDNVVKIVVGSVCEYRNYDTDELISFTSYPLVYISSLKEYENSNNDEFSQMTQFGESYYQFAQENKFNFEYLGEKELNNRKTIVIKIIEINSPKDYYKYYIDKDTGVIVGIENFYNIIAGIILKIPNKMRVEFDCVVDEDVKKPNMVGYVIRDFRNVDN